MRYTLMSRSRELGTTGVELPPPSAGSRSWHFIPGPAFVEEEPLFAELPAAIAAGEEVIPSTGELEAIPEAEREDRMREMLLSDPRMARFLELSEHLEALELALHDPSGVAVPTRTIGVTELAIPPEVFQEVLRSIDAGADLSLAERPPFYLLVASLA